MIQHVFLTNINYMTEPKCNCYLRAKPYIITCNVHYGVKYILRFKLADICTYFLWQPE